MQQRSALMLSLAVTATGLGLTWSLAELATERRVVTARDQAVAVGESAARAVDAALRDLSSAAQGFAALAGVARDPAEFARLMAEAGVGDSGYEALLADGDGIVVGASARPGRLDRIPTGSAGESQGWQPARAPRFYGPMRIAPGQLAVLAVAPVPRGEPAHWLAWVAASRELTALLTGADLESLRDSGYEYELWQIEHDTGIRRSIVKSREVALVEPVLLEIPAARGAWNLSLAPRRGWPNGAAIWTYFPLAVLLSIGVGVLAYELARRPQRIREEVERRTRYLHDTNRRLLEEVRCRKEIEEKLSFEASHDSLTGLSNRTHFLARLELTAGQVRRHPGDGMAVLFIGVDRFKHVTDSLGQKGGDRFLTLLARELDNSLRPEDTLARIAGDRFAALLGGMDGKGALEVADAIRRSLREPLNVDGQEVFASVSVGVFVTGSGYEEPEELLKRAEMAMDEAKARGGDRVLTFEPSMREKAAILLPLETDLRHAIEREEFRLFYQPIVAIRDGSVVGVEALIRWQHPLEGLVAPGRFLPLAESSGLVVEMNRWVVREACRQARRWWEGGEIPPGFYLSVNLSGRDFDEPDLCDYVAGVIRTTGAPAGALRLEITEGVLIHNLPAAAAMLERFRGLGIGLLLDDFGTGYSSLSYLHRFDFDVLKIDRSFVRQITAGSKDARIVRGIVHLAADLGMKTVAEGVEDQEHLARLRELGCDYAQGYLFARPQPPEECMKLFQRAPQRAVRQTA